jgi:hypothetical protein
MRPPWWLCEQWLEEQKNSSRPEWVRQGIGCDFGCELSLVPPDPTSQLTFLVLTLQYCLETFEAIRRLVLSDGLIDESANLV